jgi:non-specific serine/threonine protein kinase
VADIFISYSSKDREKAEQLAQLLSSAGVSVWIDKEGIQAATSWTNEIAEALDTCKAFVLLLSADSLSSKNVIKELSLAAESDKQIIPVELEAVTIPTAFKYHLAGLQRTQFTDTRAILQALVRLGIECRTDDIPSIARPETRDSRPDIIRLAVLPFEDQSPAHDNEWFADGMMDELIGTLSGIEKLHVASRSDVIYYKRNRPKLSEIAAELRIRYIVEGSVQKSGEKIRLRISLADAKEHEQVWTGKYDGTFDDIFDFQEQTATSIAEALRLVLTPQEEKKIEKKETENADAYELYLKGLSYYERHTKTDYEHAMQLFDDALAFDPNFVLAYVEVANVSFSLFRRHSRDPKWLENAEKHIAKAEAIEGKTARILAMQAYIAIGRGNAVDAGRLALAATQLDAAYAPAFDALAMANLTAGKEIEAISAREKYLAIRPDDRNALVNYLSAIFPVDKEKARRVASESVALFERHVRLVPDDLNARVQLAMMLGIAEERPRALVEAEIVSTNWEKADGIALLSLASFYQVFGFGERVMPMLYKCIERGYRNIDMLRGSKVLTPIQGTPEFEALMKELEAKIKEEKARS